MFPFDLQGNIPLSKFIFLQACITYFRCVSQYFATKAHGVVIQSAHFRAATLAAI